MNPLEVHDQNIAIRKIVMKNTKRLGKQIFLMLFMDLMILSIPFIANYLFGLGDRLGITAGELVNEETDQRVDFPGLYVKDAQGRYYDLNYELDELTDKFPEEYYLGDHVLTLYWENSRLQRPNRVDLIYIFKLKL